MKLIHQTLLTMLVLAFAVSVQAKQPIPVKVVVVTMFETGEDSGDAAGEDKNQPESLLEAVASTCCKMDDVQPSFSDVENQKSQVVEEESASNLAQH